MSRLLFVCSEEVFGAEAQFNQLQEEAAEMIAAVNQCIFRDRDSPEKLIEEMAATQVMIEQVLHTMGVSEEEFEEAKALEKRKTWSAIKKYKETGEQ